MKRRILFIALMFVFAGVTFLTGCTDNLEDSKEKAIKNIQEAQSTDLTDSYKMLKAG